MRLEVIEYVELKDGGAVVTFEMDEDTRAGLISEALQRRIIEGLERMPDAQEEDRQPDIEDYIAGVEAGGRMDTVEPAPQPSVV
jgi:hypothetical protein